MKETIGMNYDQLYRRYHGKIAGYLSRIVGGAEAEDLVQEVFLKAGRKLDTLRDESRASSWIFKIALNTARDRMRQPAARKAARAATPSGSDPEEDPLVRLADTRARTAEQQVARSQMIECYLDFVRKLPRNYYDVYVLSELEELSDKAISRRLSLSLETVKIRLHRARTRLYEQLRSHCRCYYGENGELMGAPRPRPPTPSDSREAG
jgi:RNA polymerase sigma-70 factor (ECF subfamily)